MDKSASAEVTPEEVEPYKKTRDPLYSCQVVFNTHLRTDTQLIQDCLRPNYRSAEQSKIEVTSQLCSLYIKI